MYPILYVLKRRHFYRNCHSFVVPFNWIHHLSCVRYLMLIIESFLFIISKNISDDNSTIYTDTRTDCTNIGFIERFIKISSGQYGHRNAGESNVNCYALLLFDFPITRHCFYGVSSYHICYLQYIIDRNRMKTHTRFYEITIAVGALSFNLCSPQIFGSNNGSKIVHLMILLVTLFTINGCYLSKKNKSRKTAGKELV